MFLFIFISSHFCFKRKYTYECDRNKQIIKRQVFSFSKKQIQTTCGYLVKRESLLTWSKRLFFRLYKENRDDNKK